MKVRYLAAVITAASFAACRGDAAEPLEPATIDAAVDPPAGLLPRAPGRFAPSFLAVGGEPEPEVDPSALGQGAASARIDGQLIADVDTCSMCHPDAVAQWSASAHSFASFGNPIYRDNVERFRTALGRRNSQHCGGCHDVPLELDGDMLRDPPAADLRSHTGVACRVCHGVQSVTTDGNGSYVLARRPPWTPDVSDPASIERHRRDVRVTHLGPELCVSCHRGFLSPDVAIPVHLSGLDEPTFWRGSAWNGSGTGRVDQVERRTCIDCHMAEERASPDEVAAHDGRIASHRFLGGHTWMAAMRGDRDQLERLTARLRGVASIDVAAVLRPGTSAGPEPIALDVVVRNRLVGHRFPGGVLDMQDTWIEVEVRDRDGRLLASSGTAHATDPDDEEAHVLRSYVVDDSGRILDEHEMPRFRALVANHTLAAREATVVRYLMEAPAALADRGGAERAGSGAPGGINLPLQVTARLRHRSRGLRIQRSVCAQAQTPAGQAFLRGARGARDLVLAPCAPQPITEIASTVALLGAGPGALEGLPQTVASSDAAHAGRPAWERRYEHGMALTQVVGERLDEARVVLEAALAELAPLPAETRPRAMILVQLAWVAARQGRTEDALDLVAQSRALLPEPHPPVLDTIAADARARVWRWRDAVAPARAAAARASGNTAAQALLARVLASTGDDRGALAAARAGLALSPRDPDLLRSQAAALRALGSPDADAALAAYERFRAPDDAAALRIACVRQSARCAREREIGHVHVMRPPSRR